MVESETLLKKEKKKVEELKKELDKLKIGSKGQGISAGVTEAD